MYVLWEGERERECVCVCVYTVKQSSRDSSCATSERKEIQKDALA